MNLLLLSLAVFLSTLILLVAGYYFVIEIPMGRKRIQTRMKAIQELDVPPPIQPGLVAAIVRREVLSEIPALNRFLLNFPILFRVQLFLRQASVEMTVATFLMISASTFVGTLLFGYLGIPVSILLVVALPAGLVPSLVVTVMRQRRFSKFEEVFPDAMDLLARAVRAGHAFTTSLELIGREMPEPVAGEFLITYEQQNLGLPMREALHNLVVRVPVPDVKVFVSALQVQSGSGGNLAEILDTLSLVIRERFKIMRQIRVYTAQGRLTLYFLSALPPIACLFVFLSNPDYMMVLFQDPMGQKALAVALVLQVMGYGVIRKIIKIKV